MKYLVIEAEIVVPKSSYEDIKCHARMRKILSFLHIPKTTYMSCMYEANYSG